MACAGTRCHDIASQSKHGFPNLFWALGLAPKEPRMEACGDAWQLSLELCLGIFRGVTETNWLAAQAPQAPSAL